MPSSPIPVLAFKAGKSLRREGTNLIEPLPTKGAISLHREDGLVHFKWTNRESGEVEEDLILFPQDASFSKVEQDTSGRTYVLKFQSSDQKHFFWCQDISSQRDAEFADNINIIIENPDHIIIWREPSPSWRDEAIQRRQETTQERPAVASGMAMPPLSAEQLGQLRELVNQMAQEPAPAQITASLRDILTVENLSPLFTNHPELISAIFQHLPSDLPDNHTPEALQRVIASPQFQSAVANFDQALHTGLLGGLVRALGLPEEAGTGVEPFLRAVQEQARRQRGTDGGSGANSNDQMETD